MAVATYYSHSSPFRIESGGAWKMLRHNIYEHLTKKTYSHTHTHTAYIQRHINPSKKM